MSFVAVPNTAEFIVRGSVEGQEVVNTFYGIHTTTFDLSMLTAAAGALSGAWATNMLPHLGASYHFAGVHAKGLRTPVDLEADYTSDAGDGSASGQTLPNNVAWAVKRITGLAGRSARGRVFIGGLTAASLTGTNEVNTGVAVAIIAALESIGTAWIPLDWFEVLVSRVTAGVPNIPPVTRTITHYVATDLTLDSQRRRLPGRGI